MWIPLDTLNLYFALFALGVKLKNVGFMRFFATPTFVLSVFLGLQISCSTN